jgi:hypothetical protein
MIRSVHFIAHDVKALLELQYMFYENHQLGGKHISWSIPISILTDAANEIKQVFEYRPDGFVLKCDDKSLIKFQYYKEIAYLRSYDFVQLVRELFNNRLLKNEPDSITIISLSKFVCLYAGNQVYVLINQESADLVESEIIYNP